MPRFVNAEGGNLWRPADPHVTSQCLEIADWTCADCIAAWCSHECHSPEVIGEVPC